MPTILLSVLTNIFRWVFNTSKKTAQKAGSDLVIGVGILAKVGAKQLREFLAAVPMLILFVRELIINRKKLDASAEWMLLGAGAALGTLFTLVVISTLCALPVQLTLLAAYPLLGAPLIFATGLTITSVTVFLVWIIVFVINLALIDSPIFLEIRDRFLPKRTKEILEEVQVKMEQSGADLLSLSAVVEQSLIDRGAKANAEKLDVKLLRVAQSRFFNRNPFISTLVNYRLGKKAKHEEVNAVVASASEEIRLIDLKQKMREQSDARRKKAVAKAVNSQK